MARHTEQLEREVEAARADLALDLDALRERLTPGQIAEEVFAYARETPIAEFARNTGREVRANPMPLLVIFAGIAWAVGAAALYSNRRTTAVEQRDATIAQQPPEPADLSLHEGWEVEPISEPAE